MRILAGKYKNRSLKSATTPLTRPTLGRVRQVVFDLLQNQIQEALFLDLYAGTGAMGIEALSRGAELSIFVESSQKSTKIISQNLEALGIEAPIYRMDVEAFVKRAQRQNQTFDIIYADPPYAQEQIASLITPLCSLLKSDGILIVEQSKRSKLFDTPPKKIIGDTALYLFQKSDYTEEN